VSTSTTRPMKRVGDVRAAAHVTVALPHTPAHAHAPVASFPDDDHVTWGTGGVQRLPLAVVAVSHVIRCQHAVVNLLLVVFQ